MLGWIFKKTSETPAGAATPLKPAATTAAAGTTERLDDTALWQARLAAAAGDDVALLGVARQAPGMAIKCAAVEAMRDEAALKQAEREFRTHDRRVHRAAKQRHDAAVAQRVARERANGLIDAATALLAETTIPTNRLVELDRSWHALDPGLLADAQKTQFADLSAQLTELTRERGERDLHNQRWMAAARQALLQLNAACADAAAGAADPSEGASASASADVTTTTTTTTTTPIAATASAPATAPAAAPATTISAATAAAQACALNVPDHGPAAALQSSLQQALQQAAAIEARLALLQTLQQSPPLAQPAEAAPSAEAPLSQPSPLARWQALPPVTDPQIAAALNRRFEQGQAAAAAALQRVAADKTPPRKPAQQLAKRDRAEAVAPVLQRAEAALESGNLAETHRHLLEVDAALSGGLLPDALRARLQALQAEYARLKGWQHWGGGRAREDLVQEAQTLATATTAALADPLQAGKVPVKQLADVIDDLRKRWKELDRLGGATNQTLWHGFDAALKTAFEPVAAHLAELKARRKENLAARLQLITALEAAAATTDAATDATTDATADPATDAATHIPTDAATAPVAADPTPGDARNSANDWREQARALAHFQQEWRKLGPVEHTVPHKARDALVARMQASVARIEAPLQAARSAAQQVREQLVARAQALSIEAAANPHGRDVVARVRELQEQWQQHARTLPLARPVENALWAAFKTATDAVFVQRDAAYSARDAELLANLAAREALIQTLQTLTEQTPATEFKRVLAGVDAQWRQGVDVPRQQVASLDARFHAARQAAQQMLAGNAQRIRQARFDALTAKLALCEALEQGMAADADAGAGAGASTPGDRAQQWAALPALQPAWEEALAQRWQRSLAGAGPALPAAAADALDAVLLRLEVALEVASPPAFQAARRDMKLLAMKAALEGRPADREATVGVDALMVTALLHAHSSAAQSLRLHAIIAALRSKENDPP